MKRSWISALAILVAAPAAAGETPSVKPAPSASYDWTGPRIGVNFGWSWDRNAYDAYKGGALSSSGIDSATPFHGGVAIGYDYMFASRVVVGVAASIDASADSSSTNATASGSVSTSKSTDAVGGAVLAKLGYAFDDLLLYVDGGWAWSSSTVTRTQLVGNRNGYTLPYSDSVDVTRSGWDIGAGAAYHIWGGWEVSAEYDYKRFGRVSMDFVKAGVVSKSTLTANNLTLAIAYKF